MSKNNEKYYYSKEEDDLIVKIVRDDFLRRQKERRNIERIWELNLNFYLGNQFSYISNIGDIGDVEKRFSWEGREVYNHIAPIIECRLAKLNKVKPNLTVRPASSQESDIASAEIAKNVLKSAFDKNSIDSLVMLATAWSEITGTAFYKIVWDNGKGDIAGEKDNKKIKNGDVVISVCSPFEFYPDSNSVIEIEDCESIIVARACPVKFINSEYELNISGEDIDIYELASNSFLSNFAGRSNIPKIVHSARQDSALLIEKYQKPSADRPNGRFTVICQDKLIYDGELPYMDALGERIYPFVKQVSTKQITSFWGSSVIERCIPIQRAYNSIKNKKHEYIARLSSGVLTVEDGSVDVDILEEDGLQPGRVIVYRNGSKPPEFLDPGSVPIELEKEEMNLLAEMNNLCCVSDISINSAFPSNLSSGSALSILIEQDESRLSLVGENIRLAIKKIGEVVLKLYKQYASTERIIKISNSDGVQNVISWNNSQLSYDDVVFETLNEFEESVVKQKQMILSLYEKGLFADESGEVSAHTKRVLIDLLGVKNFITEESLSEIQKNHAVSENLNLEKLDEAMELDDHKIHIEEHMRYLLTNEQLNRDKVIKQKLINHIKQHKNLLKEEEK